MALTLFAGPATGGVALQWRGAETPGPSLRLAVRGAVAELDGRALEAVPDRALARARVAVSREYPAAIRELRAELRVELNEADAAYRQGRFDDARALLDTLLASLHAHPEVPGAAASAREAHLLAARVAWAAGETSKAERALAAALRLDPEARLSTRRAPPDLVERHRTLQSTLLATRETDWIAPIVKTGGAGTDPATTVEIDGVPGLRPVPPGPHFVVVYRDGHQPVAAWRELDVEWAAASAAERISTNPDVEHEAVCRALGLEVLVIAERRGAIIGLEGYRCGAGFGPVWSGNRERLDAGVTAIFAGPFDGAQPGLGGRWAPLIPEVDGEGSDPTIEAPRPWFRRGWIWGTSAGVAVAIAGGVVAGVLLGGRKPPGPSLEIDAGTFLGGR